MFPWLLEKGWKFTLFSWGISGTHCQDTFFLISKMVYRRKLFYPGEEKVKNKTQFNDNERRMEKKLKIIFLLLCCSIFRLFLFQFHFMNECHVYILLFVIIWSIIYVCEGELSFPPSSAGIRYTLRSYVHANVKKHRRSVSLKFLYIFELLICDYIRFLLL